MATVKMEITPEQAGALSRMLDLAVRIHLCQFREIPMLENMGEIKHRDGRELNHAEWDELEHCAKRMAEIFGFSAGASFGIGSTHVSDDAHRAYEVKKVLDKALAVWREPSPQGIRGVNYDGLIVRYTSDPAPVVEVRE